MQSPHTLVFATLFAIFGCSAALIAQPESPTGVSVTAYDHHLELNWDLSAQPGLQGYRIYSRSPGADEFAFIGFANNVKTRHIDFVGAWDTTLEYYLTAVDLAAQESTPSDTVSATTFQMTDDELLDMVQRYTLRYFWDFAHPISGLARERNTTSTVTSGGSGFGVMAIIVGAERGFITYEDALTRTDKMVDFLLNDAARFKGVFPHWLNGATGQVIPFSAQDNGGDLVETSFLIQGLLTARQYYSGNTDTEIALRQKITQIWEEVNWNWYRKQVDNVLYWHWSPNFGFAINLPLRGFNEVHITYLLAIASPVNAFNVPASLYHTGWAGSNYENGSTYYGYPLEVGSFRGGPLFFSHYSYLGFDPRGIADEYTNYFARNTYHTLINQAHCIANPYNREGYSAECWGLTASDDPFGYLAHSPASAELDNGTIAPTAALGSMPYTPGQSIAALKHFYRDHGAQLWGEFGFYDAFNLGEDWFANSYLAIDQGPIICMIENYRSGLLWDLFMQNPEIQPALDAIGFGPDSTVVVDTDEPNAFLREGVLIAPQPVSDQLNISFALRQKTELRIELLDVQGRMQTVLEPRHPFGAGQHQRSYTLPDLPAGLYYLRLRTPEDQYTTPLILQAP